MSFIPDIGVVSGYFNPLHYGHIEYINAAKKNCSRLIAIINSDAQVALKGSKAFMDEAHRKGIVENLRSVDECLISIDSDKNQCETLKKIRKDNPNSTISFFNSGDRKAGNLVSSETKACEENNIFEIVIDLPKIYSSSLMLLNITSKIEL